MQQRKLRVYVDGFNLYHGIHDAYGRSYLWLDLVELAKSLRPKSVLEQVTYFTASVLDDPDGLSRQQIYQKALRALNPGLLSIVQGRYRRKSIRCHNCGSVWRTYEEKETDVNIAVQLVADSLLYPDADLMVISADSDLAPPIREIQSQSPRTFIVAAFPPNRRSGQLKTLMPASFQIGEAKIRGAQLPQTVTDPITHHVFARPAYWT